MPAAILSARARRSARLSPPYRRILTRQIHGAETVKHSASTVWGTLPLLNTARNAVSTIPASTRAAPSRGSIRLREASQEGGRSVGPAATGRSDQTTSKNLSDLSPAPAAPSVGATAVISTNGARAMVVRSRWPSGR